MKRLVLLAVLVAVLILVLVAPAFASSLKTTTVDGSVVNENFFDKVEDVYVTGGPQHSGPTAGRLLPNTVYVAVVVEPNKRVVLSLDPAICRLFRTNEYGFPAEAIPASVRYKGKLYTQHNMGVFAAYAEYGAKTYQLKPFSRSSNNGGVHKVLAVEVDYYKGDLNEIGSYGDYLMSGTKQDTFKVKCGKPFAPPFLNVNKFHDANGNGTRDDGEELVTGWPFSLQDPDGITDDYWTPAHVMVSAGNWKVTESVPSGVQQTAAFLNSSPLNPLSPTLIVPVAGTDGETQEVAYGNVGLGKITAKKVYSFTAPGSRPISGWKFELSGTLENGETYGPVTGYTGSDGTVAFENLLPGTYNLKEIIPNSDWINVTPLEQTIVVESKLEGSVISGSDLLSVFTNYCTHLINPYTKGGWAGVSDQEKGLDVITAADTVFFNSLVMYADNLALDGSMSDGTPYPAANGSRGEVAPAGSVLAEYHYTLLAPVSGDRRVQLKAQFTAFALNCRHFDGLLVQMPDGTWESFASLAVVADAAWESNDPGVMDPLTARFAAFNESDAVRAVCSDPPAFTY